MKLRLRALEPTDLEMMYDIENDKSLWVYSNTSSPFSKHTLKKFIENSHLDILDYKQVRLVIYDDSDSYGFIDLFDYDHISIDNIHTNLYDSCSDENIKSSISKSFHYIFFC